MSSSTENARGESGAAHPLKLGWMEFRTGILPFLRKRRPEVLQQASEFAAGIGPKRMFRFYERGILRTVITVWFWSDDPTG